VLITLARLVHYTTALNTPMKKLLLLLALFCVVGGTARGTDIVLSSTSSTQIPFNPSNLGNDRDFTVTATSGSATITSAALFPSNIVGKVGFTVSIGGVFYTVASVASTSSLTLTKAFTGSTGSAALRLYKYTLFRAFPTAGFQSSTTTTSTASVAVVNGSATVTSSALFPAMYTGVAGGYQVLIDGVPYQVLWQASTSSLTLTQTYAGTTGAATMTFDGVAENVQASAPGSGNWYKEVAVSVVNTGSGNVLYYPSFVVPATTNASFGAQARYTFGFYPSSGGSALATYTCGGVTQLAVPATTPTTWTALCNYNAAGPPPPPPNTYYNTIQIDQRLPPCTAGQSYYFSTTGNILSCLNFGSGLTLTGNTLSASGGGGSITDYRGAINVSKAPYSCTGDGVASDQTCLAAAITAAAAAGGKIVYIPAGTYLVTGLTVPGGVTLVGDGKEKTIIKSATNGVILDLVQGSGTWAFIGPRVSDLWVDGSDSGSSQIGINVSDAMFMRDVVLTNITISDCGSHGLAVGNAFSSEFRNIYSTSNIGYNFFYLAPNMPANYFYGLYSGDVNAAAPAGFRIKQGDFTCWSCNGVNVVPAVAYWAVIGGAAGDLDGDVGPFYASASFTDCNIEGAPTAGVLVYPGSVPSFLGITRFVGLSSSSGSWSAILYDTDASLTPENLKRGYIEDTVVFANSPASYYANSQPIRSDGLPPLSVDGRGPSIAGGGAAGLMGTYYNTVTSRVEQLARVDGYAPVTELTASASFTNPGGRAYRMNCAAPCTLTLPSPNFYEKGNEVITVFNISATGINVTINANGGAGVNGGSYVLSVQGASVQLYPDFTALDWRVIGNRIGAGSTDFYPIYDSANTIKAGGSLISNSGSNLLFAGTTLYGADNTIDIGSSSDNRPRNIYGATALTVPRVYYGGGGASDTGGSATPEGAVTAEPGSMYKRTNGSWYIKASGSGNTGWTLVSTSGSGCVPGGSAGELLYDDGSGSCDSTTGLISDGVNVTAGSGNFRATRPRFTTSIDDSSGNELLIVTATGSAVNEITLANAATGNNPTFTASGGDTNVGINFVPKGSGTIQVSGVPIVTTTAAQSLTNKTLTASSNVLGGVTMTLGSDADGDMYYRASGVLTRLPKGTALQQLRMNAGATAPEWATISGGGTITGSGSTGTIAKFTGSSAIGDSLLSESGSTVTTAGRQTITGLTINADATNTVASLTANATFTKNNSNPRDFFGVLIKPTFNFGGSNSATIVSILEVDSVNTNVTGLTTNLLSLKYGGNIAFNVDSDGGITFANGIRQAFAPSTIVASLNVGQVAADPSSPVNGDVVYETNTNKFRCYENSAWVNCISSGANAALSNLASVAINTSLLSDTTLTDDLGSASFYWRRSYVGQQFVDATLSVTAGNQTINKAAFRFVIAAGNTNAIITNSFVTTSSLVICTVQTNDTTMKSAAAVPASGSVQVFGSAAATADTTIACNVINQ